MKVQRVCFVLALSFFPWDSTYASGPVYQTVCRRTGGSISCYQDGTWSYNERTHKCYRVQKNKEPCGFFDGEKGCKDFCLKNTG
ncbi:uncharacterized protein LOC26526056 [Drosophila erecta]|uniref:BPTI/Kunitz inhibitor domain-containing protein n=1 Tax=Drosophila erecta TaxID=7220 RepID=A0A0Q5WAU2_DROER|nr:uncharacterized protein LOC26526056 [Drosophila erecta]KQS70547.1 uncharacterized protein Dere_GG26232 [Drosophila erecta]